MAKTRMVNTRFWDDDYTANLNPTEKLLFLYLLTNTSTDICGVYEIPLKKMVMDTGINKDRVEKTLDKFTQDKKIFYVSGWVAIKNFIKNQSLNPRVIAGVKNGLDKAPKELLDSLCIGLDTLSHLNSNLNLNSNSNLNSKNIVGIIDAFKEFNQAASKWYGNKTQRMAADRLSKTYGYDRVIQVIKILPKTNRLPYVPNITTPLQLEDKWSALESSLQKKKGELQTKKYAVGTA